MSIEYDTGQSKVCITHSFNETYTCRRHVFSLFHFTTWKTSPQNHCGWCNYLNTRCAVMIVSKTVSTIRWCLFCLCQCHHVCNDTDYITMIWIWHIDGYNAWGNWLDYNHSMSIQSEHALQVHLFQWHWPMVDDPLDILYNNYWQYFLKTECLPNSESDLMDALTDVDKALDSIQWLS